LHFKGVEEADKGVECANNMAGYIVLLLLLRLLYISRALLTASLYNGICYAIVLKNTLHPPKALLIASLWAGPAKLLEPFNAKLATFL
jgi:hypothetical protein